jgi:hypothetical protein
LTLPFKSAEFRSAQAFKSKGCAVSLNPLFLGEYMKSFVSVVSALMVSLSMLAGLATTSSAVASEKVDCSKKENAEKKECKKK